MTNNLAIAEAVKAYEAHRKWQNYQNRNSKRSDTKPVPTASDVLDVYLGILGERSTPEQEHKWAVMANEVIETVVGNPMQPPRMAVRQTPEE